ncbi:26S protease regulatory subunit 8-like [Heracleum sosnowskyi]|uniref:26S protease regulatory subunit 8-like n=1 Tax=Heracleum sosnowskyi TaxID=360622 RepID=A0AAD8HV65_9APIA|nr:26S protease regulatory subunit 8-like [Heracleum sosnowskyi]
MNDRQIIWLETSPTFDRQEAPVFGDTSQISRNSLAFGQKMLLIVSTTMPNCVLTKTTSTAKMSLNGLPSPATIYATYASVSSSVMLLRTTFHQIVPRQVQQYVLSAITRFFYRSIVPDQFTLVVEESRGMAQNYLYDSFQIYMTTKDNPKTNCLKISQSQKDQKLTSKLAHSQEITEFYQGIEITWAFICRRTENTSGKNSSQGSGDIMKKWFELRFKKVHKETVMDSYIPFVLEEVKAIKNAKRVVKLHTLGNVYGAPRCWDSITLEHSSTFETLAMEPNEKKALKDDLDLFVKRKDYFKRVGRAWKRGYLLYGPPGTGKSSLVAAMANYLKFDIYDLQLMNVTSDFEFRRLLLGTANRSILVIEDIDCSVELPDRKIKDNRDNSNHDLKFTLSGLLNFIDGIWSSCGDERIIIFTTNNKDKLDPALLRPGRMDMHIHMSYLTFNGFKTLASTYLDIKHQHWRFREIEELFGSVQVTPAEVAEELMKSSDSDVCLGGLVDFLNDKKRKRTTIGDGENTDHGVKHIPQSKKMKTNGCC